MSHIQYICDKNLTKNITSFVETHINDGLYDPFEIGWFLKKALPEDVVAALMGVGVSAKSVIIHALFDSTDEQLGLLVHESMSRYLCNLDDIKYPYEKHKFIYPKSEGKGFSEWGNGYGVISPHSDDLYENIDTDLLSLTVLKDETNSSTLVYDIDGIVNGLSKDDMAELKNIEAVYMSGKNVDGQIIKKSRPIVESKRNKQFYNMDFRVEAKAGPRMMSGDKKAQGIIDKLRTKSKEISPISSNGKTGTFLVISNREVLHGRQGLHGMSLTGKRLLFRSKGSKFFIETRSA